MTCMMIVLDLVMTAAMEDGQMKKDDCNDHGDNR